MKHVVILPIILEIILALKKAFEQEIFMKLTFTSNSLFNFIIPFGVITLSQNFITFLIKNNLNFP